MASQWWHIQTPALTNAGVRFGPPMGSGGVAGGVYFITTASPVQCPCPAAGTLKSIYVLLGGAPGVGTSYRIQLDVAGVASTVLDVTIANAAVTASASGSVAIAAGNLLNVRVTPSGAAAAVSCDIWLEWEPTTANQYVYFGGGGDTLAGGTGVRLGPLAGVCRTGGIWDQPTTPARRSLMPFAATLRALYVRVSTAPGGVTAQNLGMDLNGATIAASAVSITGAATSNNVTGLSTAIAALDTLSFKRVSVTGVPVATQGMNFGCVLEPVTSGDWMLASINDAGGQSAVAAYFGAFNNADFQQDMNATETLVDASLPADLAVRGLAVETSALPGIGNSTEWRLRVNAANSIGPVTFTNAGPLVQMVTSAAKLLASDLIAVGVTPISGPINPGNANWSLWCNTRGGRQRTLRGVGV